MAMALRSEEPHTITVFAGGVPMKRRSQSQEILDILSQQKGKRNVPCPECNYTDRIIVRHKEAAVGYEFARCTCTVVGGIYKKKDVDKEAVDKANSKKQK